MICECPGNDPAHYGLRGCRGLFAGPPDLARRGYRLREGRKPAPPSAGNLKQLGLALLNYESAYGSPPPMSPIPTASPCIAGAWS